MLKKLLLRRRFIVDKPLQYGLIGRMVAFVLFTFVVMSAMLFIPLIREMSAGKAHGKTEDESVGALLYMHDHFWPVALACLIVAIIGVVLVSHRIAGPLVRVKRIMRFVEEGHFPQPLQTRTRDYFKPEVEILNTMVQSLAARVETMKQVSQSAQDALDEFTAISEDLDPNPAPERKESLARLAERITALHGLLNQFTSQRMQDPERLPGPGVVGPTEPKSRDNVLV